MAADQLRDPGRGARTGLLKLVDALEDNDDVQNVYANFDIPETSRSGFRLSGRALSRGSGDVTRLMGIDPGLRFTGWGVIEAHGNRLRHIADGVIATDNANAVPDRLKFLHEALTALFLQHCRTRPRSRRPMSTATARPR